MKDVENDKNENGFVGNAWGVVFFWHEVCMWAG